MSLKPPRGQRVKDRITALPPITDTMGDKATSPASHENIDKDVKYHRKCVTNITVHDVLSIRIYNTYGRKSRRENQTVLHGLHDKKRFD